jgi:hypothetical protein
MMENLPVCHVCQDRKYRLGWSFSRVQHICKYLCPGKRAMTQDLKSKGYRVYDPCGE